MSSFGEHLRRQRETRGISLDQIMATTKISRRLLQALEDEQFDLLPGGIFNKSYVKAYAKCVGLDEDEAVAEYLEASRELPPDTRVIAQQHASLHSERRGDSTGFPMLPVLILIVIVLGGAVGWKFYQNHEREKEQRAPTSAAETATMPTTPVNAPPAGAEPNANPSVQPASPAPVKPSTGLAQNPATPSTVQPASTSAVSASQPPPGGQFEITVRPKDRAWVSIKADGRPVVQGILKPPEVRTIRASSEIVFFTGNAGAVDLAFEGKNVPLTGGPNAEQVLVFNSRGLMPKAPTQ